MYVCIISHRGKVKVHQNIKTDPEPFFELIFPYFNDVVVGVECVFCWYWLADFCAQHHIPFILGRSLYINRCLVQTRQLNALTLTPEDESRNQRVVCQEIRCEDRKLFTLFLFFRSIGVVFSLTTEGHIDVRRCTNSSH